MQRLTVSLKSKMTIGVCLIVAAVTSVLAFVSQSYFQRQLRNNVAAQQSVLVASIAGHIDGNLGDAQQELLRFARSVPGDALTDPARGQRFLDSLAEHSITFDNSIILFSPKGDLIAESPFTDGRRGKNFAFREFIPRTAATRKPCISAPFFSTYQHRHPLVVLTEPLFDASGALIGILAGGLDLTQHNFLGKIAHTPLGKSGYLYLFDTRRTIIMHPDQARLLTQDVPVGANPGVDRAIAGYSGTLETADAHGNAVLASYQRLANAEWILAAQFPQAEAYQGLDRMRRVLTAAVLTALAMGLGLSWFFMGQLTAPLQRFAQHVSCLTGKRGDDRLFTSEGGDEIDLVARAFNAMVQDLDAEEEELRRARDAAEAANRLKREFLATVSHEIRTPMNGVLGMTELLRETALSPEQAEYVVALESSTETLVTVINDILDYSRIETLKLELAQINFGLRASLKNLEETFARRAAEKGIALSFTICDRAPDPLVGDPGRLVQVLVNLLSNAVKFTRSGAVRLGVCPEMVNAAAVRLRFSVTDTGIGITPEQQKRIFEAFSQVDGSTTRCFGGSGLGLAISSRLVQLMGGELMVESEPGAGSCFRFTLPLRRQLDISDPAAPVIFCHSLRPNSSTGGAFDQEGTLARVAGDRGLLCEVVEIFAVDSAKMMADIRQNIAAGDGPGLRRAAHTLKGAAGNFGARFAFDLALELEILGKDDELADASKWCDALETELEQLREALGIFARESGDEHFDR